jgi:hypothetical protein
LNMFLPRRIIDWDLRMVPENCDFVQFMRAVANLKTAERGSVESICRSMFPALPHEP